MRYAHVRQEGVLRQHSVPQAEAFSLNGDGAIIEQGDQSMSKFEALAIEVGLRGGLGNQLFGYGAGFEIASRLGLPLYLNAGGLSMGDATPREFELGGLTRNDASWGSQSRVRRAFRERSFAYDERVARISRPVRLEGYFQSYRYFSQSWPEIRKSIWDSDEFQRGAHSIPRPFIAIQVRRGDYLKPAQQNFHGLVQFGFFETASSVLRSMLGPLKIVVFSDDQKEGHSYAGQLENAFAHSPGPSESSLTTLGALSSASGFAISNSSFGWWAAYLRSGRAPVIAPRPWFQDRSVDTRDLLPSDWFTLGT